MPNYVLKNGSFIELSNDELAHYKYVRKERGSNGKWIYYYDNKKMSTSTPAHHEDKIVTTPPNGRSTPVHNEDKVYVTPPNSDKDKKTENSSSIKRSIERGMEAVRKIKDVKIPYNLKTARQVYDMSKKKK